jgi:hypothetical protein
VGASREPIADRFLATPSAHTQHDPNTSTTSINHRINFHMSAIKQINQYWFSQLIFSFVAIEFQGAVQLTESVGFGFG